MIRDSGKTRSLAQISDKILKDSSIIETTLSSLLSKKKEVKVLEVGFGYGRPLLELAWRFRDERVSFYGINREQQKAMKKPEDLVAIARDYKIIPEKNLTDFVLPELFFHDATQLHFDDESIDFIYSAITIRFIEDKAGFLEEVCRVLKPGGTALLDMSETNWNYPYSRVCHDKMLTPYMSRFVLKYRDELIPLPVYLRNLEDDSFRLKLLTNERCTLKISKLQPARLSLQLEFNHELSVPMREFSYKHWNKLKDRRGGYRSVYNVRQEIYEGLFEKGFLSHDQLRSDIVIPESI